MVLKSGTSELGSQIALSHTSSLVSADKLYDALFERVRIIRVRAGIVERCGMSVERCGMTLERCATTVERCGMSVQRNATATVRNECATERIWNGSGTDLERIWNAVERI